MPMKATNLDTLFLACDPEKPLDADDDRYVDLSESRGIRSFINIISRNIRRGTGDDITSECVKYLFTGHRGSGKSTELLRLKRSLENMDFFVVYLDIETQLDLATVNHLDVLLAIAKQVEESLRERRIELSSKLLTNIAEWFDERVIEKDETIKKEGGLSTEAKAGADIPFFAKLLAKATASIRASSTQRVKIRRNLEKELVVFLEKLNVLILEARNQLRKNGFKDLVLLIDGLEKMHFNVNKEGISSHSELFVSHAEQLRAPKCHIIYTTPISLAYNHNLGMEFSSVYILPMVKTDERGIEKLIEIINKRADLEAVFAKPEALKDLARLSGGVVRDLMRLVRHAADSDNDKISREDIQYACDTLVREYDRLLRNEDIELLKQVREERRVQADEKFSRLLNLRLILEYQNGDRWATPHPALERIKCLDEN